MNPEFGPQIAQADTRIPELVSSNSFRVEYPPGVTREEMSKDIKSYVFEFRLRAQKYDYDLLLSLQNGTWRLGDPDREEPMTTKARRAVAERKLQGEPTHREEAEFMGLTFLEQQLGEAQIGDSIIWFSPPGPKSEGYGDYGFGFKGEVTGVTDVRKTIKMTANRFEKPILTQYNDAFRLLVGKGFNGRSADDFLRTPIVIKGGLSEEFTEMVFANKFGFVFDSIEAERNNQIYETRIKPLEDEFIASYEQMTNLERIRSIHAMENIATKAKRTKPQELVVYERLTLAAARVEHGHEPEKVAGSCPVRSNNPLSGGSENLAFISEFGIDYKFDKFGHCKSCGNERVLGPCAVCLPCDIKMRQMKKFGMAA